MQNYVDLLEKIVNRGEPREDRTGIGSRVIWGAQLEFYCQDWLFPAVTARPVPLRWVFEELMMFLRGETQTKCLEEKGITIWKGNTTREFLDSRGLTWLEEGDMGKGYGYQWRKFNCGVASIFNPGVDQLKELIEGMQKNPESRRHIITAWNPQQLKDMALPPCHILQHYNIVNGWLNGCFWMRSNDVLYGLPFNIAQYAFMLFFLAKLLGLKPGKLVYQCSDAHLYENQIDAAKQTIEQWKNPDVEVSLPWITLPEINSLDDLLNLEWSDIEMSEYVPLPDIKDKPAMAV